MDAMSVRRCTERASLLVLNLQGVGHQPLLEQVDLHRRAVSAVLICPSIAHLSVMEAYTTDDGDMDDMADYLLLGTK